MSKHQGGERISVLISDSTRMGCQLLSNVLQSSRYKFSVVASVTTSRDLLAALNEHEPRVAVISAMLQDGSLSGLRVAREVHAAHPELALVVLLDTCEKDQVVEALRAGARGIFCRVRSPEELCKCIHVVQKGQIWASNEELEFLLEAFRTAVPMRPADSNGNRLLTRREEEVVTLVAEGMSNREVSSQLKLSEHTVKNYMFRIFNKLGISSRVELILYALNHNAGGSVVSDNGKVPVRSPSKSHIAA